MIDKVAATVNGAYVPIPDDYELAFQFLKDEKSATKFYVLLRNLRSVQVRKNAMYINGVQGLVTLNDGTEFVANGVGDLPSYLCPKDMTDSDPRKCVMGYGGGRLFDDLHQQVYSNVRIHVGGGYDRIEVVSDSTAKATFAQFIKVMEERNQVARDSEEAWRRTIAEGVMTSCGMVVEKRTAIASVQTAQGVKWLRLDQLKQPGTANAVCN